MRRAAALLGLLALACGGAPSAPPGASRPLSGDVVVFAAASLTGAFAEIGGAFERAHPGTRVRFSFGGSSSLAAQLIQGAPADAFAAADPPSLQRVIDGGVAAGPVRTFARNRLAIVVPPGNPRGVRTLADLADPALVVVLCAPAVPCGAYAQRALAAAGVRVSPRSQEQDVKGVVTKVGRGEADAGIAYTTDVLAAAGQVRGVDIPEAQNVPAVYPVASLPGPNPAGGRAFADYLLGRPAQDILGRLGFAPP